MKKLTKSEFLSKKRESLLDYVMYESLFDEGFEGFERVRKGLSKTEEQISKIHPYKLMAVTQQRAWYSLGFLVNYFNGGHDVDELKDLYPAVLQYWETYLKYFIDFLKWDTSSDNPVAALSLLNSNFVYANQLISLGILLGHGGELSRVSKIIDLNNFKMDGMLERLLSPYSPRETPFPNACTRHLPYFKTLKIFDAPAQDRLELMREYLEDWYYASRREPYYDSHERLGNFKGYWSWESAAITYLLDIDDRPYRQAKFYPVDLVDFARATNAPRSIGKNVENPELREKSGQPCPRTGIWEALDIPVQRREFSAGDIMQAENAGYGMTVWRYIGDRLSPR
jgi:hypothetical protein